MSADDRAPQGQSRDIVKQFTDLAAQPEVMDPDDPWRFDGYNAEDAYRAGLEDGESRLAREWLNEVVRLRAALSEQEPVAWRWKWKDEDRWRLVESEWDMPMTIRLGLLECDPDMHGDKQALYARTQSLKEGDDDRRKG